MLLRELVDVTARFLLETVRLFETHKVAMERFLEQIVRIQTGPPAPGHETLFISQGYAPFMARLTSHAVSHLSKQLVAERTAERSLAATLREIAKAEGKSLLVAARRARALRAKLLAPEVQTALANALTLTSRPSRRAHLSKSLEKRSNGIPPLARLLYGSLPRCFQPSRIHADGGSASARLCTNCCCIALRAVASRSPIRGMLTARILPTPRPLRRALRLAIPTSILATPTAT